MKYLFWRKIMVTDGGEEFDLTDDSKILQIDLFCPK